MELSLHFQTQKLYVDAVKCTTSTLKHNIHSKKDLAGTWKIMKCVFYNELLPPAATACSATIVATEPLSKSKIPIC